MALEPDKYLIGIAIFSLFILVGVNLLIDMNNNYDDVDISLANFDNRYNQINTTFNESAEQKDLLFGLEIDEDDTPNSMFKGAYSALRTLRNSFRVMGNIFDAVVGSGIPVPNWLKPILITVITILILFSLVYLVFRFQPRK